MMTSIEEPTPYRLIKDIKIFETEVFRDGRGDLFTTWERGSNCIIDKINFNHDKISISHKNVIRGLHGDQKAYKFVSCVYGSIFFVVVDMRKDSPTYLSGDTFFINTFDITKRYFFLLPPGIANGFAVLSDIAVFNYKWQYEGAYPDVQDQFTIRWDDPTLGITWPIENPIISDRDKNALFI